MQLNFVYKQKNANMTAYATTLVIILYVTWPRFENVVISNANYMYIMPAVYIVAYMPSQTLTCSRS